MAHPSPPPDCSIVFAEEADDSRARIILNPAFDAAARLTGAQAMAIALDGLPPVKWCKLDVSLRMRPVFLLEYDGVGFSDTYRIVLDRGTITDGNLECNLRDRTTGRRMFANRVVLGRALGLQHMTFEAARAAGGLVWARAGALPASDDDRAHLSEQLFTRAALLSDVLDRLENDRLLHLCTLAEPQALWSLADWALPVDATPDLFTLALRCAQSSHLFSHDYYAARGFLNGGMTLNRFMLLGTAYPAVLHFDNAAQMERLADYTGVNVARPHVTPRVFVP